ncbi:hypothetical protein, variant [Verruconis gallopava]|nr:hypothetical protein, variant [Verruconis gallopava]KIW03766.1 hypothetical protein, variant [Verruconis gallopava]
MEKITSDAETPPERISQLVSASNLTYWEALWNAAKQTKQVMVLRRHGSPIDIIAENGRQWIKVSTITEKRLLMEMAKQGWDWPASDEDSDDDLFGSNYARTDDHIDISLVKMAVALRDLAKQNRVRYKHPEVHFILTRISSGNENIDIILNHIRATGAVVHTAEQLKLAPPVEDVLDDLVIDEFKFFSATINIDCTLLLALVSDISHGQVKEEPWFNRNVRNQIQIEEKEQLMPKSLWPAMRDHSLVCTKLAAQRMREIVDTIGTPTERERARLIMGDDINKSPEKLLEEFRSLSVHDVPKVWKLPVKIVDEGSVDLGSPTTFQENVISELSDINRSVFLYGWLSGCTTITSNRVAAKAIEKAVEEYRTTEEDEGPDVWICPTARSLVAKEKDRKDPQPLNEEK